MTSGLWECLWHVYERQIRNELAAGARVTYRVHFREGDAGLDEEAQGVLTELARALEADAALTVGVDAFGDDPCSQEDSVVLSGQRKDAVAAALETAGVDPARIRTGFLLGGLHHLAPRDCEAGRAFNRRVEARVIY